MVTFESPLSSSSPLDLPPVTQYFSVTSLEEEEEEPVSSLSTMSQLGVKECSVHVQRQHSRLHQGLLVTVTRIPPPPPSPRSSTQSKDGYTSRNCREETTQ